MARITKGENEEKENTLSGLKPTFPPETKLPDPPISPVGHLIID